MELNEEGHQELQDNFPFLETPLRIDDRHRMRWRIEKKNACLHEGKSNQQRDGNLGRNRFLRRDVDRIQGKANLFLHSLPLHWLFEEMGDEGLEEEAKEMFFFHHLLHHHTKSQKGMRQRIWHCHRLQNLVVWDQEVEGCPWWLKGMGL